MPEVRSIHFKEQPRQPVNPEIKKSPEYYNSKLTAAMAEIAKRTNAEVLAAYKIENLLNLDNSLNMENFARDTYPTEDEQEFFSEDNIQQDEEEVSKMEIEFSRAKLPRVQSYYLEKYGAKTEEQMVDCWRKEKARNKNGLIEKAVTLVLNKILGKDYLVVRTSTYDDYKNGVDNIVVNKNTGEVICAFDEVHGGGEGERIDEKINKVKKVAAEGGARVCYGMKFEEGKLKRARMKNVPVFFMGLRTDELDRLLANMDFNPNGQVTKTEYATLGIFIASLKEQLDMLNETKNLSSVHPAFRDKLASFGSLIADFEEKMMGEDMAKAA